MRLIHKPGAFQFRVAYHVRIFDIDLGSFVIYLFGIFRFTGLCAGFKHRDLVSPRKMNQPRPTFDRPPVVEGAGVGALWEVATHMHKLSCPGFLPRPQPISSLISTFCQHFRVSLRFSSCFSLSCFFFFSVFSSGDIVFSVFS